MTIDEFRAGLERFRAEVDREAQANKDSQSALPKLFDLYRDFSKEDRAMADEVIAEWVLSNDECKRFDALALVREFRIVSAKPALERVQPRLRSSVAPGAAFELQKVLDILSGLREGSNSQR